MPLIALETRIVVSGVRSGLIGLGDEVMWEATHLGVRQRLTARMHVHEFREEGSETVMLDRFDYTSPLGPLGRLADWLFLERADLKQAAESADRQTTTARPGNER